MHLRFLTILILLLLGCGMSTDAMADISGSLAWSLGQYNAKEGGSEVTNATSFTQKYHLMFDREGTFLSGRGGHYNLSLGGEWYGLQLNRDYDADIRINRAKLLYRGEVVIAPGGLPLYIKVYGHDRHRTIFQEDTSYTTGSFDYDGLLINQSRVLSPKIYDDVLDGTRVEYGASMVLGIKNGSYLGRYRNILSHFPKLYVDYRETQVDDSKSLTPENYRDRELAFVSLNKKHNWFHYRFFDHKDKIDPKQDYFSKTYLLGTVDQNMRREWVNLTNWIQVSADGSYTTNENPLNSLLDKSEYLLNLFAQTSRKNWRSSVFSRYWRKEELNSLERYLEVPVFAEGEYDRDNVWRLRFVGTRELDTVPFSVVGSERADDNVFSGFRWETGRTQTHAWAPTLEAETRFGQYGQGGAVRGGVEYFSNRGAKTEYDIFSSLKMGYFWGAPPVAALLPTGAEDISLVEGTARFDIGRNVSERLRVGGESLLAIGSGTMPSQIMRYVRPESMAVLEVSRSVVDPVIDGSVLRGKAMVYFDHKSASRVNNRLELGVDYLDYDTDSETQVYLKHQVDKRSYTYNYKILSEILYGDSIGAGFSSSVFGVSLNTSGFDGVTFMNVSEFGWTPDRNTNLRLVGKVDWQDPDGASSGNRIGLTQQYSYVDFVSHGVVRKLYEIRQTLDFESLDPAGARIYRALALACSADYYPVDWLRLGTKVRWQRDLEIATDDVGVGLYTDLKFELLKVNLEYEYGMRTMGDTGTPLDRDEQRWRVSIEKTF